jgi:carboxymethylenebutenolidase
MLNDSLQQEFDALLPGTATEDGASRRTALKVALGVGYAASVSPICAQTAIKTDSNGLKAGEISFMVDGFKVPTYYAMPAGKTGCPVVLVVQEIFGVHEYIADTCRRFAKQGYLAVAVELFARQGDPTKYGEIAKLVAEVVSKVPDAQVMADLDGAVKWAAVQGGHHRLLLGRAHHLAVCRARQCEGGRGLVRPPGGQHQRADTGQPDRSGAQPQGAGARAVW